MVEEALLKDLRRRMEGAFEALRKEFSGLQTPLLRSRTRKRVR